MAVTLRVLRQLRRDPRTVVLLLVVPPLLMTLMRYVFDASPATFDRVGAILVGVFPFTLMFVVTSITMLRERTSGTLERLMAMPIAKADLLLGYGTAFAIVAAVQGALLTTIVFGPLGVDVQGPTWLMLAFTIGNGVLGSSLGLLASAFAQTEFQAVQFMPAIVIPQLLLCGLLTPRESMVSPLRYLSDVLPMSWSVDGLQQVAAGGGIGDADVVRDLAIVLGVALAALVLGAATLRRRTA
jgi:ABC-2 type transport system permease protein